MVGCSVGDDGGAYVTQDGLSTQDSVLKDLELHITMVHNMGTGGGGSTAREAGSDIKPDKFPRPEISDPATDGCILEHPGSL